MSGRRAPGRASPIGMRRGDCVVASARGPPGGSCDDRRPPQDERGWNPIHSSLCQVRTRTVATNVPGSATDTAGTTKISVESVSRRIVHGKTRPTLHVP